jgi:hypothetical protein
MCSEPLVFGGFWFVRSFISCWNEEASSAPTTTAAAAAAAACVSY